MSVDWTRRVWAEFRLGNLTRSWRDVLLTLATYRGRDGVIYPSHETLAARCGLKSKTAERALKQARILGLVTWTERRVRRGWRWLRTSNLYRLVVPEAPLQTGLRQPRTSTRVQNLPSCDRRSVSAPRQSREELINVSPAEQRAAQQALAAIAAARMRVLGLAAPMYSCSELQISAGPASPHNPSG